jgi:hypothetical protein
MCIKIECRATTAVSRRSMAGESQVTAFAVSTLRPLVEEASPWGSSVELCFGKLWPSNCLNNLASSGGRILRTPPQCPFEIKAYIMRPDSARPFLPEIF